MSMHARIDSVNENREERVKNHQRQRNVGTSKKCEKVSVTELKCWAKQYERERERETGRKSPYHHCGWRKLRHALVSAEHFLPLSLANRTTKYSPPFDDFHVL